jgi:hypothetical protein
MAPAYTWKPRHELTDSGTKSSTNGCHPTAGYAVVRNGEEHCRAMIIGARYLRPVAEGDATNPLRPKLSRCSASMLSRARIVTRRRTSRAGQTRRA